MNIVVNPIFREKLEFYMSNNVPVSTAASLLNVSRQTIYNELRYGLTEEEVKQKLWKNYKAETAQKNYQNHIISKIRK